MKLLAIETSCDETSIAVVEKLESGFVRVISHVLASSSKTHVKTGGIVPEVAAREQLTAIIPTLEQTLAKAISLEENTPTENIPNKKLQAWVETQIDALAVTQGPGLIGSLLVGVETAKTLAYAWGKPLIPVNHIVGHIYANWIETNQNQVSPPAFPLLALTVSGGHTNLIYFKSHQDYTIIGTTRDDAAGECFDKCARVLGLKYPGGPKISKLAAQLNRQTPPLNLKLPRPLLHEETYDVSFSGLKSAFVRQAHQLKQKKQLTEEAQQELAYDLELAITEVFSKKVLKAIEEFQPKSFLLCGGVSANLRLRDSLKQLCEQKRTTFFVPDFDYCMDNAAMIGAAAIYHSQPIEPVELKADPSLQM